MIIIAYFYNITYVACNNSFGNINSLSVNNIFVRTLFHFAT